MDTGRSACHGRASATALRYLQVQGRPPHSAEDHSQQFDSTKLMSNTMSVSRVVGWCRWSDGQSQCSRLLDGRRTWGGLIIEFEANVHPNSGQIRHHDTTPSAQKAFAKDVRSILAVTKDLGDPFEEDSLDLQVLDTKDTNTAVIETVCTANLVGQEQFQTDSIDCSFIEPRP